MTITWPFYPPACQNGMMNMPPGCQVVPQPLFLPASSQRIEMWGLFGSTATPQRLVADVGSQDPSTFTGFSIVPAIDPNDPCLIRGMDTEDPDCAVDNPDISICGAQIFSKKAHTGPGLSDNDALLAQQQLVLQARKVTSVVTPFLAVDAMTTGQALGPLLTFVQWNPDAANDPRKNMALAVNAASAADPTLSQRRFEQCKGYRGEDPSNPVHPYFYVGNPHQVTKPLAGVQFGFLAFSTGPGPGSLTPNLPPQNFNGVSFALPMAVDDINTILITLNSGPVSQNFDPNAIQLFAAKRLTDSVSGRGAIRLGVIANSTPPLAPGPPPTPTFDPKNAVGTISLLSSLDSELN